MLVNLILNSSLALKHTHYFPLFASESKIMLMRVTMTMMMTTSVLLTNDVWVTSDLSLLVPRIRTFLHPVQPKSCLAIAIIIIVIVIVIMDSHSGTVPVCGIQISEIFKVAAEQLWLAKPAWL